jgi:dolichol-phosphate mannosyltransferase
MSGLGFLMAGLGVLYAITIVIMRFFFYYTIPTGWASMIIIFLTVSGTQLILMGILGEYLWRVLDESRRRPLYIVESVDGKNVS